MFFNPFDELVPDIHFGLAALWLLLVVLFGYVARRARHRWVARAGIMLCLGLFLAGWASTSPLARFLDKACFTLFYPANCFISEGNAACFVVLVASNVVGIVSIWAGLGRPLWFVRVLPIAAIPPLSLLVGAYGPCVVFLVQSAVTIVPLLIIRNARGLESSERPTTLPGQHFGYGRLQFSVLDMLATTLLAATVSSVAVYSPEQYVVPVQVRAPFTFFVPSPPSPVLMGVLGVVLGLVTLVAAWVTLIRSVWWFRVMGLFLAWPALLCVLWLALWREAAGRHFRARVGPEPDGPGSVLAFRRRCMLGRVSLILLTLLTLVPLGIAYYHATSPPPIPAAVLPVPNGYDDLLAAGRTLAKTQQDHGEELPDSETASNSDLIAFRASSRNTWNTILQEVHAALDRPGRVPLQYQTTEEERYWLMWCLARALRIEGRAVASEGRIPDAIRCFADMMRLGRVAGHGGLVIDRLAGCSIESNGIEEFHHLARLLDAAQCQTAIEVLAAVDDDRELFECVWQRECLWDARALGWSGRVFVLIGQGQERRWLQPICEESSKSMRAELRIAITELAVSRGA